MKRFKYKALVYIVVAVWYASIQQSTYAQLVPFIQAETGFEFISPSFAGAKMRSSLKFMHFDGLPKAKGGVQYAVNFNHYVPQIRSGMGFSYFPLLQSLDSSSTKNSVLHLNYSYAIILGKKLFLKPGLSIHVSQQNHEIERVRSQDIDFSLLLYNQKFWFDAGYLSAPTKDASRLKSRDLYDPYIYLNAGYKKTYKSRKRKQMPPALQLSSLAILNKEVTHLQFLMAYTRNSIVAGLGYRKIMAHQSYDFMNVRISYRLDKIILGYAYNMNITNQAEPANHEIYIGLRFNNNVKFKRRHKIPELPCI